MERAGAGRAQWVLRRAATVITIRKERMDDEIHPLQPRALDWVSGAGRGCPGPSRRSPIVVLVYLKLRISALYDPALLRMRITICYRAGTSCRRESRRCGYSVSVCFREDSVLTAFQAAVFVL